VRKAAGRVRITGQLIDAFSGAHIWADRFEGTLENVFELQDQVASAVVGAIDPKMLEAEIARAKRKPVASLDAYDCFLRASDLLHQWTNEGTDAALALFKRAIEIDPDYAQAHAFALWCYAWRYSAGSLRPGDRDDAVEFARKAARLGKDDAFSLSWAAMGLALFTGELDEPVALTDRALALNPNLARSWNLSGWINIWRGEPDIAIEHLARAMRLSPLDFAFHAMETTTAFAHLRAERYDETVRWAEKALRHQPNSADALRAMVIACALAGDLDKARQAMQRLLQIMPTIRVAAATPIFLSQERRDSYANALRQAGMPD
jgi:adenylate cyclase